VDCYCSAKSTIELDRTGPSSPERRRRWSTTEKLRIVEESLATGAVTSEWHADTMSIPTSFMPGGDLHGAVYWSHCPLQQMRTRAVWDSSGVE
jgi:hypothetical protein